MENSSKRETERSEKPASQLLDEAGERARKKRGERIALGELIGQAGCRVYGLVLMLLALPEGTPVVTAGLNTVFAIPLLVLAVSMILFGFQPRLPPWLRNRSIKRSWVEKVTEKGGPWLRRLERISRPRLQKWTEAGRPLGVMCLALTVMMIIPMPLTNLAPAWCVIAIGFGIFQRDGLFVAIGVSAGLGMITALIYVLITAGRLV